MLSLKNLSVSVKDRTIIKNLSYHFKKGKIYAIMGPNGSGKSTLAHVIAGDPLYTISADSKILFNGADLADKHPHIRAKKGIFLSFQNPPPLEGVTIHNLMYQNLGKTEDIMDIRNKTEAYAKKLRIKQDLLYRSLFEHYSGGEKKKLEMLQALLIQPKLAIFDEIDSGVDIDTLKLISQSILEAKKPGNTFIIISHYKRIFNYITPDIVLILKDGKIVEEGNKKLIDRIEKEGYQ